MPPQMARVQQLYLREEARLGLRLFDDTFHQDPGEKEIGNHNDPFRS